MAQFPAGPFRGPNPIGGSPKAYPRTFAILSVDPSGDYLVGGTTVTITGKNFGNNADGTAPTVLFGSTPGTSVVVVDATTITVTVPAAAATGLVNLTVTVDGISAVLYDAFLYFETALSEVSPGYGSFGGGTQVEVRGYNIAAGTYQIRFGATLGTNVVYIDEEHLVVTTPSHALGFVDVILETSPGGVEVASLTNGFQFTQLTRGEDIRRQPGITIQDALNNQPNSCTFSIDGTSNRPVVGEQINIIDSFDADRLLFAGNVQRVDQEYENDGQTDQLVWRATAVDFTWLMSRRRPSGSYANVSATDIVKDLITRFAPGFNADFVQTNLARISIKFDGSRDLATCLTDIGLAIGGGHWYVDYTQTVHFFHVKPISVKPISPIKPGPGSALTAASGAAMPDTQSFTAGYYYFRSTFLYSNGTESSLGPASVIVALDGLHQMALSSIPTGADPGGGITCTGRRIYFVRGTGQLQRGWKINDNVTTTVTVYPGMTSTGTVTDESRLTVTITLPPPTPPPPVPRTTTSTVGTSTDSLIGVAPHVQAGAALSGYTFSSGDYHFTLAAVYPNGTQTEEGPASNKITLNDTTGPLFTLLPAYPSINGMQPIGYRVFVYCDFSVPFSGVVGGVSRYTPHWPSTLGVIPYAHTTAGTEVIPATPTDPQPAQQPVYAQIDFGVKPVVNTQVETVFTWPNNDGPYLEDADPPDDVTDDSPDLLRNPQIVSSVDMSQIRNRVTVLGAATSVTVDAVEGDTELEVADVSIFNLTGGTVLVDGSIVVNYFSPSSRDQGQGSLFLETALGTPVYAGASVQLYLTGEDRDSQNAMGKIELDVNGDPTDGIHEYVVSDTSLVDPQQLYTRLYAELELFAQPITTVTYATRDPKTRSGQTVHFDMADPPLKGDFLIQNVTIDQIHDESDQLSPRYVATATSARFMLEDLLLQLIKNDKNVQSSSVSTGARGVIDTAITGGPNGSFGQLTTVNGVGNQLGTLYWSSSDANVGTPSNAGGVAASANALTDGDGFWARLSTAVSGTVCQVRTSQVVSPQVSMGQVTFVVRTTDRHDSQRIWVCCVNGTSTLDSDSLVNAHACGWRLSSVTNDLAFRPFINNGLGNGIELSSGNRASNNWVPNTTYVLSMVFAPAITFGIAGGPGVAFYTNGEFVAFLQWSNTNVQQFFMLVASTPQVSATRTFDVRSMAYTYPYSFSPGVDTSIKNFGKSGTLTGIH